MTARSIALLYLFSRSSRDEFVWRACLSKSSFATSISRSLCCSVRFVSRKVVISFSKLFWAALVSVLDSLYFLCERHTAVSLGYVHLKEFDSEIHVGESTMRTFHSSTS